MAERDHSDAAGGAPGLPPLLSASPTTLILGSFPGGESLRQTEYYAQPRNAFWRITAAIYDFDAAASYADRCAALTGAGVALWDVIGRCERPGSLDSRIDQATIVPNDLPQLLEQHPSITKVILNGRMAETQFAKRVLPQLPDETVKNLTCRYVPSTSPANAAVREEEKLRRWLAALRS